MSRIARIFSAASNNHRAGTIDLVEDRFKPFRMLRLHGQLEVSDELALVSTAVVDRSAGAVRAQVVGRELPTPTVIPNHERHIRVHGLGAERQHTQSARVVDVADLVLSPIVITVEFRTDAFARGYVLVRQDQGVVARGSRDRVEAQRELEHLHHEVADEAHEAVLVELLRSGSELTEAPGVSQLAVGLGEVTEGFLVGVQLEAVVTFLAGLDSTQEVLACHATAEDVRSQQAKRGVHDRRAGAVENSQGGVTSANPGKRNRRETRLTSKSAAADAASGVTRQFHRLALEVVGGDPVRRRAKNVVDDLTEVLLGLRLRHDLVEAQDVRAPRLLFKRVGAAGVAPTDLVFRRVARLTNATVAS